MTRRRLAIVVVALAVMAVWLAWHISVGLSAEERALVGMWQEERPRDNGLLADPEFFYSMDFRADRSFKSTSLFDYSLSEMAATWYFRDGIVVLDHEPNPIRRVLRPLSHWVSVQPAGRFKIVTLDADRMTVIGSNDKQSVWTRIPAE